MSPEPPLPDLGPPLEMGPTPKLAPPPDLAPAPESYPFWGYPDLFGFILVALLGIAGGVVADGRVDFDDARQADLRAACPRRFCSTDSCSERWP